MANSIDNRPLFPAAGFRQHAPANTATSEADRVNRLGVGIFTSSPSAKTAAFPPVKRAVPPGMIPTPQSTTGVSGASHTASQSGEGSAPMFTAATNR